MDFSNLHLLQYTGFNALDLTDLTDIQGCREILDSLVLDLSIRLSTLGYDTEFYYNGMNETLTKEYNLTHGCDNITTVASSNAFVAGDTLTFIGRTLLASYLPSREQQIPALLERIYDVELSIIDLHYALYEVHRDLLKRSQENIAVSFEDTQKPLHSLKLADDIISSSGNDTIVGDSACLFYQIDSSDVFTLESTPLGFTSLSNSESNTITKLLSDISNQRKVELTDHIDLNLIPSEDFTNEDIQSLPFADVPFMLSIGNDIIDLNENNCLVSGDFAVGKSAIGN